MYPEARNAWLFPSGLVAVAVALSLVAAGALDGQTALAALPACFLALLTALELWRGRWRPAARRLPRDLTLFAVSGALDALSRVGATKLSLALGAGGPASALPLVIAVPAGLVLADLGAYAVHRAFHRVPALWRVHALHHAPTELYALMSSVNGPLMVLAVRAVPLLLLVLCGFPPLVVLAYALTDAWVGLCSHTGVDTHNPWLSRVLVTPEVHRVHHSGAVANHALLFTLWDRVFGTFAAPVRPEGSPGLGREVSWLRLLFLRE